MILSIIIPAYNAEQYIEQCIDSCENQDIKQEDYEIIIINDGSNDNTFAIANRLSKKYNNIIIKTQKNQGQAVARNLGIDIARGKYIMFVDADDYLIEHKLQKLLNILYRNNTLEILSYRSYLECADGKVIEDSHKGMLYNKVYLGEDAAIRYSLFGSVCLNIYKLSLFKDNKLRFLAGIKHEDSELCFRLYPKVKSIMFVDELVYFYRYNINSTDRCKSIESITKSIESDLIIASLVKKMTRSDNYSKFVRNNYRKISNSMVVSYFFYIRKYGITNGVNIEDFFLKLKELGVYPIDGKCTSLKTSIIAYFFNNKYILKLFLWKRL